MTQDKMRRIITACVSAATVLLVFLLAWFIGQRIKIANYDNRVAELQKDIAYWTQKLEQAESEEEYLQSEFYLNWKLEELELIKKH